MLNNVNIDMLTPSMRHYVETKQKNPEAFLFYRLGDFYELFFQDAIDASRLLNLTLTKKSGGLEEKIPMCGVPYRVSNQYIARLINMGYKVAICDQVEDPKQSKGLVRREITKIVTPATFTDTEYLSKDSNKFLMSIWMDQNTANVVSCNYLTGSLQYSYEVCLNREEVKIFLDRQYSLIRPAEVIIYKDFSYKDLLYKLNKQYSDPLISELEEEFLSNKILSNLPQLKKNFSNLKESGQYSDTRALLLLLNYLSKTQMNSLDHLRNLELDRRASYMNLSESTKYNLELISSIRENSKKNTLYDLLDKCLTAMGSRLLKKWISRPLLDREGIRFRQKFIESFQENRMLEESFKESLNKIYDFDRLAVKISQKSLSPKDLDKLAKSLKAISSLKIDLKNSDSKYFQDFARNINDLEPLSSHIDQIIMEDPTSNYFEEKFVKSGYDLDLDELFKKSDGGIDWLIDLEKREQNKTEIKNLKIKYNKILGYFFEVTKSNLDLVPEYFIRKQTLVGSERFYTIELKEQEESILKSKDLALEKQIEILNSLRVEVLKFLDEIQKLAEQIASIDCLFSLSRVADKYNYICPEFNDKSEISIRDGRHPVVEAQLELDRYVPNDVCFQNEVNRIQIITGPNMAGKSTYMRQTAIILIMAQIGSFVPASYANLSLVDNIFTRIGASDNLASGQSTFMVEMMEVSYIIDNLSPNSLILLDEVGRGTSTHDGLSIAISLVEYLAEQTLAKVFFATHYFQLTQLKDKYKAIKNLTIATENKSDEIIFLRKIVPGESSHSFGIEVAKLAGVNQSITKRAKEILLSLEDNKNPSVLNETFKKVESEFEFSPDKFVGKDVLDDLKEIDINSLTPIEALQILNRFQIKLKEK